MDVCACATNIKSNDNVQLRNTSMTEFYLRENHCLCNFALRLNGSNNCSTNCALIILEIINKLKSCLITRIPCTNAYVCSVHVHLIVPLNGIHLSKVHSVSVLRLSSVFKSTITSISMRARQVDQHPSQCTFEYSV